VKLIGDRGVAPWELAERSVCEREKLDCGPVHVEMFVVEHVDGIGLSSG